MPLHPIEYFTLQRYGCRFVSHNCLSVVFVVQVKLQLVRAVEAGADAHAHARPVSNVDVRGLSPCHWYH